MAKNKFTGKQQRQILAWIAAGYGATRIVQFISEKWDMECSRTNIQNNYIDKKEKEWMAMRIEADKELQAHPLYAKRHRLDIILEAIDEAFTWRTAQIVHNKGMIVAEIQKKYVGIVAPLLAEASKLIEGTKTTEININNWQGIVEAANAASRFQNRSGDSQGLARELAQGSRSLLKSSVGNEVVGQPGPGTDRDHGKRKRSPKNGGKKLQRRGQEQNGGGSNGLVSHKSLPGKGDHDCTDLYTS